MAVFENQYIQFPGPNGDGISLFDGQSHVIRNCIIDFSGNDLDSIDEALGVTWGSSATVEDCVIRGAGKLVLCGSGDEDKKPIERGKRVDFSRCIFEDFSRRGPEVQDGMVVTLNECLIQNWGCPDRFTVRSFGAWAHGSGSRIVATRTIFKQHNLFTRDWLKDLIGHIGQAVNDNGILQLFTRNAWQPGTCRGLVATDGGSVSAVACYKNKWWISVQNHIAPMSKSDADVLESDLLDMKDRLFKKLVGTTVYSNY